MSQSVHWLPIDKIILQQAKCIKGNIAYKIKLEFLIKFTGILANDPTLHPAYNIKNKAMTQVPDNDPHSEIKSFLSTEFFFYLLPCYLAIGSFSYRYFLIMQQEPTRTVKELPGQVMVTCFEDEYNFDEEDWVIPPASYVIKSKLSLMNSYTYLGMCLLGLLGDPDLYYSAQHRAYSLIYLFGVIAWAMSALLLRREYQRCIGQSLWTHRFFWIFAGTFSVTKMFEDYLLPLNVLINCVFIANNCILIMYALYRPQDKNDGYFQMDDMPSFARIFFQKLQLNETVRKVLHIQNQPIKINIDELTTAEEDFNKELDELRSMLNTNAKALEEGIKLLNKLPRRNIIVNKKVRIRKVNEAVKCYFIVITQVGVSRFEAERKYSEFADLENSLMVHFSEKNFPKLKLPRLKKSQFSNVPQSDNSRRAQILQEWLQQLLNNPIFMIPPVLQFLSIDEQNSAPFVTYYSVSYTSFCSQVFLFNAFREKKQIQVRQQRVSQRLSIMGVVEEDTENLRTMARMIKTKMEFEVAAEAECENTRLYVFDLTCKAPKKGAIRWRLQKTEDQLITLNERIEEEIDSVVPVYYHNVLKIPEYMRSENKVTKEKLYAYEQYLQNLLDGSQYYTFALFEFLMFDPIKLEIVADKAVLQGLRRHTSVIQDKISESFAPSGKPIELLKIRVRQPQDQAPSYKFTLRRKTQSQQPFCKTGEDLVELRTKLVKIYRGIATIPELWDFTTRVMKTDMEKIKANIQDFLNGVDVLPQIGVNHSYKEFYDDNQREGTVSEFSVVM